MFPHIFWKKKLKKNMCDPTRNPLTIVSSQVFLLQRRLAQVAHEIKEGRLSMVEFLANHGYTA